MYSFCTLFDSNYIDKGLVTIDSLKNYIELEKIYILAMDTKCYDLLVKWYKKEKQIVIISLEEFETDELKEIKKSRSRAEYCWTCSASLISYILDVYKEECCTYMDADLCFYSDPRCIIREMEEQGKTVQIIEHRFKMNYDGKLQQLNSGRFCVEFMTFKNEDNARGVLETWRKQVINNCTENSDMSTFGDQMYLNSWEEDHDCVWVTKQVGAGVAPWNINRYKLKEIIGDEIIISFDEKKDTALIFYHFHHISHINEDEVNINIRTRYWSVDEAFVQKIYRDYLKCIKSKKDILYKEYRFKQIVAVQGNRNKEKINVFEVISRPKLMWRMRYAIANLIRNFLYAKKDIINLQEIA